MVILHPCENPGKWQAQLAIEAIKGVKRVGLNKLLDSPNIYCVDANIMKKFHLDFVAVAGGNGYYQL